MDSLVAAPIKAFAGSPPDRAIPHMDGSDAWYPAPKQSSFWELPGRGVAWESCGEFRSRGCLNVDGKGHGGKAWIQVYPWSCGRRECPICYESWVRREAARANHRLEAYPGRWKRAIHVVLSPPKGIWTIENLRKKAYFILKWVGIEGGCMVYHPLRAWKHEGKIVGWYYSPHFHVVGYGYLHDNVGSVHGKTGWIVKNKGIRISTVATLVYQLSHAGVCKDHHTLTWFGCMAYNKLKTEQLEVGKRICPLCGDELSDLVWIGEGDLPIPRIAGEFLVDPGGWVEWAIPREMVFISGFGLPKV